MSAIFTAVIGTIFGFTVGYSGYALASSLHPQYGDLTRWTVVIIWTSLCGSVLFLLLNAVTP